MTIEGGILHVYNKPGLQITEEIARKCFKDRVRFQQGKEYPAVIFVDGAISVDKPSRDFFVSAENMEGITRLALLYSTPVSRSIINFLKFKIERNVNIGIFDNYDKAIKWLIG